MAGDGTETKMRRREFLVGSGAVLGLGAAAAACTRGALAGGTEVARAPARPAAADPTPVAAPPVAAGRAPAPSGWEAVKAEFAALAPGLAHMASFFLVSHPRAVRDAIETHRRGLDENPIEYLEHHAARLEAGVRAAAAEYLGCAADDLAMTDSTTQGLGVVYGGLDLAPGQEILSTTHDHIVTEVACTQRAALSRQPYRKIALYDDPAAASAGDIVTRIVRALRPKTRVLAITWVHSGTGVMLPVRAIAAELARVNARRAEKDRVLLCVDGVHGFGIEDVTADGLGCDFFITGCHKWIFGPRGTGLVHGKASAWPATRPLIPSMDPFWRAGPPEQMPRAAFMTPGGFHSFEHRWALAEAFRFHLAIGKAKVAARIHELNGHLKRELARLPRVTVKTPAADDLSSGIVCFSVEGKTPQEVVHALRARKVVASVTPPFYVPAYARLAAGLVTVEADLETTLAAVRAVA